MSPTGFEIYVNKLAVYYTASPTLYFTACGILNQPVTMECNLEWWCMVESGRRNPSRGVWADWPTLEIFWADCPTLATMEDLLILWSRNAIRDWIRGEKGGMPPCPSQALQSLQCPEYFWFQEPKALIYDI